MPLVVVPPTWRERLIASLQSPLDRKIPFLEMQRIYRLRSPITKDLRTFLSNDLTPDGIKAVEDRIKDVAKDGRKAAGGLGELRKASETLAEKLRAARNQASAVK